VPGGSRWSLDIVWNALKISKGCEACIGSLNYRERIASGEVCPRIIEADACNRCDVCPRRRRDRIFMPLCGDVIVRVRIGSSYGSSSVTVDVPGQANAGRKVIPLLVHPCFTRESRVTGIVKARWRVPINIAFGP